MYFDQLLLAARKVHVVYSDQFLGAARWYTLYLITIADWNTQQWTTRIVFEVKGPEFESLLRIQWENVFNSIQNMYLASNYQTHMALI